MPAVVVRIRVGPLRFLLARPSYLAGLKAHANGARSGANAHARCDAATLIQVAALNLINRRRVERAGVAARRALARWRARVATRPADVHLDLRRHEGVRAP